MKRTKFVLEQMSKTGKTTSKIVYRAYESCDDICVQRLPDKSGVTLFSRFPKNRLIRENGCWKRQVSEHDLDGFLNFVGIESYEVYA